jgi:GT2 family glycosyltransferase
VEREPPVVCDEGNGRMAIEVDVSVLVVSFNTKEVLRRCLNSIREKTRQVTYEVIVIDNNSADGTAAMIKQEFPEVKLVPNSYNAGFAKANNQGLVISKGNLVCFLNPDTVLLNDAISRLAEYIGQNLEIGAIGPKMYSDVRKKKYRPSIRRFTKPSHVLLGFLPLAGFLVHFARRVLVRRNRIQYVDWLVGAALLVEKDVLEEVGPFDESYFVYSEEEDFCLRLRKAGYKVCYFPGAEVMHLGKKSSEQVPAKANEYLWKSKMLFLERYYPRSSVDSFKRRFRLLLRLKMLWANKQKITHYKQIINILEAESNADASVVSRKG